MAAAAWIVRQDVSHGVSKIFREEVSEKKGGKMWFCSGEL
jgi:hypothetical protein